MDKCYIDREARVEQFFFAVEVDFLNIATFFTCFIIQHTAFNIWVNECVKTYMCDQTWSVSCDFTE